MQRSRARRPARRSGIDQDQGLRFQDAIGGEKVNRDKFFIGGDWVEPAGTDTLAVISPHTEEVIAKVPEATTADVDRAVAAAREAFDRGPWPQMSPAERADVIAAISAGIQARYEEMARTI